MMSIDSEGAGDGPARRAVCADHEGRRGHAERKQEASPETATVRVAFSVHNPLTQPRCVHSQQADLVVKAPKQSSASQQAGQQQQQGQGHAQAAAAQQNALGQLADGTSSSLASHMFGMIRGGLGLGHPE